MRQAYEVIMSETLNEMEGRTGGDEKMVTERRQKRTSKQNNKKRRSEKRRRGVENMMKRDWEEVPEEG